MKTPGDRGELGLALALTAKTDHCKLRFGCLRYRVHAPMQWLRTTPGFVRALVALFVVAQFAGVVSWPVASAIEIPAARVA